MNYIRRRKTIDKQIVDLLSCELGYRQEVCEALVLRDISNIEDAKEFISPHINQMTPWQNYTNLKAIRDRLAIAVSSNERVVVYGDYDCDGVCATAILCLMLAKEGAEVSYYLPNRKKQGYGVHRSALEEIAEEYTPDLVITVDCGITAVEEIAYGQDVLGLEIIVTDHHEPSSTLPDCLILNPKIELRTDCFNELCGAGLALKICQAMGGDSLMLEYMDIATLATIADIVPLKGDNRVIVSHGVDIINSRVRQSIKLLIDATCDDPTKKLTALDIAFKLVPKINAIGRISDSNLAVQLLIDDDYFYAKELANQATAINLERRVITDEIFQDCLYRLESYDLVNNKVIVLYAKGWEGGVIGIVAAKIAETFRRPAILLTLSDGVYKGSCRSIEGINLYEALKGVSSYLLSFGGHSMACGLSIKQEDIEGFVKVINLHMAIKDIAPFLPDLVYDIAKNLKEIDSTLIDDMAVLEPYGAGNPPISYLSDLADVHFLKINKSKHIKAVPHGGLEILSFDGGEKYASINSVGERRLVFNCSNNEYKNRKYVQGIVVGYEVDAAKTELDSEFYAVRHLYQKKYPEKSIFKREIISEQQIQKLLSDSIYGSCFLCYNVDTFRRFSQKYGDKLIFQLVGGVKESNPFNALILDLDVGEKLTYYKNVIFLDRPANYGMVDILRLGISVEVSYAQDCEDGYIESKSLIADKFPSIDEMRKAFLLIREQLARQKLQRASHVYESLVAINAPINQVEFYIAFFALYELGIIKYREQFVIDNSIKTSLDNSTIYSGIANELIKEDKKTKK